MKERISNSQGKIVQKLVTEDYLTYPKLYQTTILNKVQCEWYLTQETGCVSAFSVVGTNFADWNAHTSEELMPDFEVHLRSFEPFAGT
jgi:hypothetical protein